MSEIAEKAAKSSVDAIYEEAVHWHVNTGGETIHAKRMPGSFRTFKWLAASSWLIFFLGPYLRWGDRQAILFDIPNRKFHILEITIMPQDVWMLSLVLLFFAILLAVVTSIAGRVFCGYFCFQTIWTDVYTWIEDKLEGQPHARRKLDNAPLVERIKKRLPKHVAWLVIAMLTGVSFAAWFTDAIDLWTGYLTLTAPTTAWIVLALFTGGTYLLAGFMREQVCFWLCPYARIQGVMYDKETILPAYDYTRGEPRGKLKKGQAVEGQGDCIDCNQCVAVCPTGIDIRAGQQEGCITCALCIDACDAIMEKISKPKGLIRYASLDELEGQPTLKLWRRPRVLVYVTILTIAAAGILYGLTHIGALAISVLHERQPLYVQQSDGSIQNKYEIKILNKTEQAHQVQLTAEGPEHMVLDTPDQPLLARAGEVTRYTVFVRVPRGKLEAEHQPILFRVDSVGGELEASDEYESMFVGPRR